MFKKIFILTVLLAVLAFLIIVVIKSKEGAVGQVTEQDKQTKLEQVAPADFNNTSSLATVDSSATRLDVMPSSPSAPKQETIDSQEIPAQALKLEVSSRGFEPKEFTVAPNTAVDLIITSTEGTHVFLFPNASLMALTTMVLDGETKRLSFTTPAVGQYEFRDDLPAYRNNTGVMIVK